MAILGPYTLAAVGSTGNNSHTGVQLDPDAICFDLNIEVAGATPTVTMAVQGSMDGTNYFPVFITPSNSDTSVASVTLTAVGHNFYFLDRFYNSRFARYYRLVTTLNTNVTYSSTAFTKDDQ